MSPHRSLRDQVLQVGLSVLQEGRPAGLDAADQSVQPAGRQLHVQHELVSEEGNRPEQGRKCHRQSLSGNGNLKK